MSGDTFSGFSDQLSIVSGIFWREQIIDNVRYIFPYIGADTDPSRNHYITSQIKKYINYTPEEKATDYSLIGKAILIQPIHRNAYMYGSDMVMFDAAGIWIFTTPIIYRQVIGTILIQFSPMRNFKRFRKMYTTNLASLEQQNKVTCIRSDKGGLLCWK